MTRDEILSKAKPITFNTEMVILIFNDRKTATRRPVKLEYDNTHLALRTNKYGTNLIEIENFIEGVHTVKNHDGTTTRKLLAYIDKEPKYKKGNILYVQEEFFEYHGKYEYKADGKHLALNALVGGREFFKWQPNKSMPKEAARLFLRVTDVYPERLQDITAEQAFAEGFASRAAFMRGFLEIYPKSTLESWNWVYEFERLKVE